MYSWLIYEEYSNMIDSCDNFINIVASKVQNNKEMYLYYKLKYSASVSQQHKKI